MLFINKLIKSPPLSFRARKKGPIAKRIVVCPTFTPLLGWFYGPSKLGLGRFHQPIGLICAVSHKETV